MTPYPFQASLKYIAGFDGAGNLKSMQLPDSKRGLLSWGGLSFDLTTGGEDSPLILPDLYRFNSGGQLPFILGYNAGNGQVVAFAPKAESTGKWTLEWQAGSLIWALSQNVQLPTTTGILARDQNGNLYSIGAVNEKGLFYADGSGTVIRIEPGAVGSSLIINSDGSPAFGGVASGETSTGGGSSTGVSGVTANTTSSTAVQVKAPTMTLNDGSGGQVLATNINVALNTTNSAGPLGIDTGTPTAGTWYHIYILGNENGDLSAVYSASASAPDLSGVSSFTHFAYASVFYYQGDSTVRPYYQRGRRFYNNETIGADNFAITNAFAAVAFTTNLNTLIPPNVNSFCGSVGGKGAPGTITLQLAANNTGMASVIVGGVARASISTNLANPATPWEGWYDSFDDMLVINPASPQLFVRGFGTLSSYGLAGKTQVAVRGFTI